jgi:DNA polymerase-4
MKAQTLEFLQQHFGKSGTHYYWIARGIDERPVCADRERKSIGAENTFAADLFTMEEARAALKPLVEKVWRHCEVRTIRGRTVTLKAKYADFQQVTRSRTGETPFATQAAVEEILDTLLEPLFPVKKGIRLLGVTLSSFGDEQAGRERQLLLSI